MSPTNRHILICRTDNIGDVVLTLPIAARLKELDPTVTISFLCRAYAAPIVQVCTHVDHVIEWEHVKDDLTHSLKQMKIDTIIIAQPDRAIAKAAFMARIRNRIANTRQKLYLMLYCNRRVRFSKRDSSNHEAQMNFEFLKPFGLQTIPERSDIPDYYDFNIPVSDKVKKALSAHPFNLVMHAKSNGHGREWPGSYYVQLARMLAENKSIHIWLTGSAKEGEWMQTHFPELFKLPNITSLYGKQTLSNFISLIKEADGLIASGTGPLHIAAAIGQRCIGFFPPVKPMNMMRWEALGKQALSLSIAQPVHSDCQHTCDATCPCMYKIKPEAVRDRIQWWASRSIKQEMSLTPASMRISI